MVCGAIFQRPVLPSAQGGESLNNQTPGRREVTGKRSLLNDVLLAKAFFAAKDRISDSSRVIGVIGAGRRTGDTPVLMANYLTEPTRRTAVIEWNDHGDSRMEKRLREAGKRDGRSKKNGLSPWVVFAGADTLAGCMNGP